MRDGTGAAPTRSAAARVEAYLLRLLRRCRRSRSTVNQAGCDINFRFGRVLGRASPYTIPLPRGPQQLPEILSREEIAWLSTGAPHVKARTLLACAYGFGLRVSEPCALQLEHIDAAADSMCVRVVQGEGTSRVRERVAHRKGAKDRPVPLAADLVCPLRG